MEHEVLDDVTRRSFFNRALLGALAVFAVAFGGGSIAVLWPEAKAKRYGGKITVGSIDDVLYEIERSGHYYHAVGRFYLVAYPHADDADNVYVNAGVAKRGLIALHQKCPHLGCRTPYCPTSGYFECPCHSARFNGAGERMHGPAPAGMWHFRFDVADNGVVTVDTSEPIAQQPDGTDTLRTGPAGEYCVAD